MSEHAFQFWHILDEQSKQRGELYEKQPAQLYGNIHPQNEGGEPALGLFYATSIKEKRLFISPSIETLGLDCEPHNTTNLGLMRWLAGFDTSHYRIYLLGAGSDYANQECFNCRLRGGTTERPDFWE